jgi:hypothetical protein
MRWWTLLTIGCLGAVVAALAAQPAASDTGPTAVVSAYGCIVTNGGAITRPAGSTIVVRQGWAEQTRGIDQDFLNHETTLLSLDGAPPTDVSDQWSAPTQVDLGFPELVWESSIERDTGMTLAHPGDHMQFNFSLSVTSAVPEIFNPAIGGPARGPTFNGPGLIFGGTCTVTAT